MRKLLDILESRFDTEYVLNQQCTVDEAMIPFKGCLGFKQYMQDKPVKWRIKVWVLADAKKWIHEETEMKAVQVYWIMFEGCLEFDGGA